MNVAIIGAGMTGLSAAEQLAARGIATTIYEATDAVGGLAGSFKIEGGPGYDRGVYLEKFYHHLFTSDTAMAELVARVGLGDKLQWLPTSNSYFVNKMYRLSTPLDLLKFTHISLLDRFRLGLLYLRTRFVNDWEPLEAITAREWLVKMAGERVYDAVWKPLLRTKFGRYADEVAAVWMWNKLKLRGSSRGNKQEERLGYVEGGFGQVVEALEARLRAQGVTIHLNSPVERIQIENGSNLPHGHATGVVVNGILHAYDAVLVTTAPEILARLAPDLPADYRQRLEAIKYMANVCLVMQLDRSLSSTYWLNIGDPTIPFTGVIEHTNMQRREIYGGHHLAYISRYMDAEDPMFGAGAEEILAQYLPHLRKMFKGFDRSWVQQVWAWRERYTQPLIGLHYSRLKPPFKTPAEGLWLCCMAQVYPEDRGMNYAVAYGQKVVAEMLGEKED